MKIDECPLGDKVKLRLVLKGEEKVCLGHHEIQELGLVEMHEACENCKFHNKDNVISLTPAWPWYPSPPPAILPWISSGPATVWTCPEVGHTNGNWTDNTSNNYTMTPEEHETFRKGEF